MWRPYTVCLLIWGVKLVTSHVLHSNKTKLVGVTVIAYQCPSKLLQL